MGRQDRFDEVVSIRTDASSRIALHASTLCDTGYIHLPENCFQPFHHFC
ncbi:MAG: hypothetical protein AB9861_01465 [Methanosarcina sp.]